MMKEKGIKLLVSMHRLKYVKVAPIPILLTSLELLEEEDQERG